MLPPPAPRPPPGAQGTPHPRPSLLQGFRYTNVIFQVEAALDGTTIKVCIELRDVNYPGATYHLTYDQEGDQMASLVNGRC